MQGSIDVATLAPHLKKWVEDSISKAMRPARGYNMAVDVYTESESVVVVPNCFAFMFTNIGDTIARVNGMVIFPNTNPATGLGDSRSISGHLLDLYKGNITLSLQAPVGAAPAVEIVQLFYHPVEFTLSQR